MFDLVGNLEDQFPHKEARMKEVRKGDMHLSLIADHFYVLKSMKNNSWIYGLIKSVKGFMSMKK